MEEFLSFLCFIVIVRKRSLVPFVSLVWGLLRLAPIICKYESFEEIAFVSQEIRHFIYFLYEGTPHTENQDL